MLPVSITSSPRPVYLLSSDEPLLLRDWLDQARTVLRPQGYEDIQSHQVETGFDWDALLEDGLSLSLFSSRKSLFIRFNSVRPGQAGARFISRICEHPPEDTVFVLVMPRLDASSKNSAWVKKIKQAGEVCELKPIYSNQLVDWISQRATAKGIVLDHQAAQCLADLTEGNLLASDQELEKLALSSEVGALVDVDQINDSIARSSRYTQYVLVDACLSGQGKRAIKILQGLKMEGLQPLQFLYALQQALETLLELKMAQRENRLNRELWQKLRIWASKQHLYGKAMARLSLLQIERLLSSCAKLDRLNKGQELGAYNGDEWLALQHLVNNFTGLQHEEYQLA